MSTEWVDYLNYYEYLLENECSATQMDYLETIEYQSSGNSCIDKMGQYEKYMVGYLDLLGAKSRMKHDVDGVYLNTVYSNFEIAKLLTEAMYEIDGSPFRAKIFSDNIVVALPCDDAGFDNSHPMIALNRMSAIIGALQRKFLEHNILSRGCITYGDLFIDDLMVFGPALIQAYEMENDVAIFPRVVLSGQAQEFDVRIKLESRVVSTNKFRKDSDGMLFLSYLDYSDASDVRSLIAQSMKWVIGAIDDENNMKILQKLEWHKNYLESVS